MRFDIVTISQIYEMGVQYKFMTRVMGGGRDTVSDADDGDDDEGIHAHRHAYTRGRNTYM